SSILPTKLSSACRTKDRINRYSDSPTSFTLVDHGMGLATIAFGVWSTIIPDRWMRRRGADQIPDSLVAVQAGRSGSGTQEFAQCDCARCMGDDLGREWRPV
ncbi:MAG: hypothetical protein V7694_26180, partial [Rhodococcus sp. (in: high G+C Gram-positive bacteria)]